MSLLGLNTVKYYCMNNKWKSMAFLSLSFVFLDYAHRIFCRIVNLRSYPPGPIGLPIFGSLISYLVDKHFERNIAKKYGKIVLVHFCSFPMIFINDSAIANEIFRNKNTRSRKPSHILTTDDGTQSIMFLCGKPWEYRRRLMQSTIMTLCATKYISQVLNNCMLETVFPYLETHAIAENNHAWKDCAHILTFLAFNTVYFANFGRSLKMDDPMYDKLLKLIEEAADNIPYNSLQDIIPWIGYLYPVLAPKVIQTKVERTQIIGQLICERNSEMKSYHSNENHSKYHKASYIDKSSIEVQEKRMTKSEQIADTFVLFVGGVETTTATLEFAVALLANNIPVQNTVREELKSMCTEVNGKYKMFDASKLNKLVLFRALVYEILRVSSIVRRSGNALLSEDIWISIAENEPKMRLPVGSLVFNSVEYINRLSTNERWLNIKTGDEVESGLQLCLENWIHSDIETGKMTFVMNPSFLVFGSGRRNCVGKMLVMKQLNIIIANLLLNFRFSMDEENTKIFLDESSKHTTFIFHKIHPAVKIIVESIV